jgi:hypothetical protein
MNVIKILKSLILQKRDPYDDWNPWHLSFGEVRHGYIVFKELPGDRQMIRIGPFYIYRFKNKLADLNRLLRKAYNQIKNS